jgi:hypothetical protein
MMQPKRVVEDLTNLGRMVGTKLGVLKRPLPDGAAS